VRHLQRIIHLLECLLSLLKETKDDRPGKFAIIFLVIHLQNLLKRYGIDAFAKVWQGDRALLALLSLQLAVFLARQGMGALTLSSASRRMLSGMLDGLVISKLGFPTLRSLVVVGV
jgi:hypothetical protein